MIKSMTGYGGAKGEADGLEFTIELKSVNNRYLDSSIRMPRSFIFVEETLKGRIQNHISRGKVDVFVTADSSKAHDVVVSVNEALAEGYIDALRSMSEKYQLKDCLSNVDLSRFQDVLRIEKREANKDLVAESLCRILEDALAEFDAMRLREGEKLRDDIIQRINEIETLVTRIEERSPKTVEEYREKLLTRMQEVLQDSNIDENRILTEAAIFADKISVNEETVRIRSHLSQLRELLDNGSPVGRKLDFLVQELNREANTIGSKGNDMDISRYVVSLKSEIEKIREQIQNIE